MTKEQLIDLVEYRLLGEYKSEKGGSKPLKSMIEMAASRAYNSLVFKMVQNGYDRDMFSKTYESIAISENTGTDTKYCTLPCKVCQMPFNEHIIKIAGMTDKTSAFVPLPQNMAHLTKNSVIGDLVSLDDAVYYEVNGETVELYNIDDDETVVLMKLIRSLESHDDWDEVHIPFGEDENFMALVAQSLGYVVSKESKLE